MISREQFLSEFSNELRGMLGEAFAEGLKPGDFSRNGAFIVRQMRQGNDLLERVYARLASLPAKPTLPTNGQPAKPAEKR